MSEPVASTLVEVVPAPQNQPPPAPKPKPEPKSVSSPGGVPGVPLAVAVANALAGVGAGAVSLGGGAVAVVGAAAGAVAIGGLARKARSRRTGLRPAARTVAAHRAGAASGVFTPPARTAVSSNSASPQRRSVNPVGSASRPGSVPAGGRGRVGAPAHHTADPKGRPGMQRTAGTMHTAAHRAGAVGATGQAERPTARSAGAGYRPPAIVHTLAKAASRLPGLQDPAQPGQAAQRAQRRDERLAQVAERTARRVAKGQAKALKAAGIDPATGAGARPKSPAAARGQITPVQAKALKRSAMRHRARMGCAALATGLVGLGSVLVGNWRHKGKVSGHMRRMWRRMAERARVVRDARDAAILGHGETATDPATGAALVPVPAETVTIPGRPIPTTPAATGLPGSPGPDGAGPAVPGHQEPGETAGTTPITLGKPTVKETAVTTPSGSATPTGPFSLADAAADLLSAATTFDPETMLDFLNLSEQLPIAFGTFQEVLRVLAEKAASELPLAPTVVEEISMGYQAMHRVIDALEEVAPTFRQVHELDLARYDNPRNGLEAERKWNV
ncbi:hypothetical protein ABZW03_32025 [Kitasatospora sp. NPDC004799]|uniref:hypothetical protein n=1 Tax=Kitasatospora sp. NPDC004799 TaxID=3154460 RepID=UPI0033B69E57